MLEPKTKKRKIRFLTDKTRFCLEDELPYKKEITSKFYYTQMRNKGYTSLEYFYSYIISMMKHHKKGIYQISPNLTLVVK